MAKNLVYIFLCMLLGIYLVTVFCFVNLGKDSLYIGDYSVEVVDSIDNKFVEKKEIIKLINEKFGTLKGKKVQEIDRDSIERVIEAHPCVKKAEVYNNANGVTRIKLLQRKPLFRVYSKENFYIDRDKKIMPFSSKYTSRVCVVTGDVDKKQATGILFDFCNYLDKDEFWLSFIEQIHINQQNDVTLVPKIGDFNIIMGKLEDYEQKMSNLRVFLDNGNKNKVWGKYKEINIKYENQVVCVK